MGTVATGKDEAGSSISLQMLAALPIALFLATRAPNYFTPLILQDGSRFSPMDAHVIFSLCLLASLIILVVVMALRAKAESLFRDIRHVSLAASSGGFVGYLLLCLLIPAGVWTTAGFVVGLLCVAVYCAIYIIVIGKILTAFTLKEGLQTCAIAGVWFSLIHLLGMVFFTHGVVFHFIVGAPLLVGLFTELVLRRRPVQSGLPLRKGDALFFLRNRGDSLGVFFVASAVFCLAIDVYTKLLTNVTTAIPSGERTITLCVCLVAFVSVYFIIRRASSANTTLLGIFCFFSVIFIGSFMFTVIMNYRGSTWFGTGAIQACELLFLFFSLMLATAVVKEHDQPCTTIFGITGIFVILLPNILAHGLMIPLSFTLGFYDSEMVIPVTAILSLFALGAVFLVLYLILRQRNRESEARRQSRSIKACEEVGASCLLTDREIEIMRFIYQGNSIKKIAELSSIASSTVQGHMKKIYAKLGVHSRQELIDMVNAHRDSKEQR